MARAARRQPGGGISITRFLYRHLEGDRSLVAVAMSLTLLAVATDVLMAFPLKFILDKIINHTDPRVPMVGFLIAALDQFGTREGLYASEVHTHLGVILFAGAMFLALGIVGALVSFAQLSIASYVAQDLGARLRNRLFEHVSRLPLEWHGRQRVGDVAQRMTSNITDIEKFITDGLVDMLSGVLLIAGALAVMLSLNWQFTLVSMIIVPVLAVVIVNYTRQIKQASKRASKGNGEMAEVATESVGAIAELKAFTLENWVARGFGVRVERRRQAAWRAGRLQAEFSPQVLILVAVSSVAIITLGGWIASGNGRAIDLGFLSIAAGSLTIGTMTVFLSYSKQLYQPMKNLAKLTLAASTAAGAAERVEQILRQPWEEEPSDLQPSALPGRVQSLPSPAPVGRLTLGRRRRKPSEISGDVVYRGVTFGYEPGKPVLQGIDLEIEAGKRIALVGLSGSGKTTLVRLLPRFYEPWAGTITIGGVDIRTVPRDVLRQHIGLVLQDSVLFEGTIRENLVLDRSDASPLEIVTAARDACIHDTILSLTGGYNAHVREHGKNFSSGQRQRITIARAILRNAPFLILDEPTANLDVEAEADVMEAIERLTAGRTVIVISHRLSTLGRVDEIAVLADGRIVERGSYHDLKRRNGAFARLLREQNRYAAEPRATAATRPPKAHTETIRGARPPQQIRNRNRLLRARQRLAAHSPHQSPDEQQPGISEQRPPPRRAVNGWACPVPGCKYVVIGVSRKEVQAARTRHMEEEHPLAPGPASRSSEA